MIEFIKLYSPLLSSLVLLLLVIRINLGDRPLFSIGNLGVDITFNNTQVAKFFAATLSLWPIPYYIALDFSVYFPRHLQMSVFYDANGVQTMLSTFSSQQLAEIGYSLGNEKFSFKYYELVDKKRFKITGQPSFFSTKGGLIHSEGTTSILVEKINGIQNYHIKQLKGSITHIQIMEGEKDQKFSSFFENIPSRFDYIRPSVWQLFTEGSFVISPMFKQQVADYASLEGEKFESSLIGMTRIELLPIPAFGDTLYFYIDPNMGAIPVAYAIYN